MDSLLNAVCGFLADPTSFLLSSGSTFPDGCLVVDFFSGGNFHSLVFCCEISPSLLSKK